MSAMHEISLQSPRHPAAVSKGAPQRPAISIETGAVDMRETVLGRGQRIGSTALGRLTAGIKFAGKRAQENLPVVALTLVGAGVPWAVGMPIYNHYAWKCQADSCCPGLAQACLHGAAFARCMAENADYLPPCNAASNAILITIGASAVSTFIGMGLGKVAQMLVNAHTARKAQAQADIELAATNAAAEGQVPQQL